MVLMDAQGKSYIVQNAMPVTQQVVQPNTYNTGYYQQTQQQTVQQQPQVQQLPPTRIVISENDIRACDVPLDADFTTFVQQDLQNVYLKYWDSNGKIQTKTYQLITSQAEQQNSEKEDPFESIMKRLDQIESKISKSYRPHNKYKKKVEGEKND